MTEQSLFILACLAGGERHGYGIAQEVEDLSDGRVRLTAGTLYGALTRLCEGGLIEEAGERIVDGRRRRYYRICAAGSAALADEVDRMRSTVATLGSRLTGPAPA